VVTALAGGPVASVVSMYQKPTFVESQVTGSCGTITQLRWSPVADTITASDGGGGIRSYGAVSDAVSVGYGPKGERIGGFDYSVKGDSIAFSAFGDDDVEDAGTDYVSFASAGNLIPTDQIIKFEFQAPYLQGLILSPEEKQVVLGNDFEPSFGIWDPGPPALVYPDVYAFSPDGSVLLIGDTNNLAAQSTTSQSLTNLSDPNTSAILGASFAPNGTEIAVIQADQSVEVLGYPACNRIYQLKGHTGTVTGAIFSHDSRYLATSSSDSTMRVWDLLTGKTIATYSYSSPLITAGFSYDSRYVAATDGGTSVIVWDAPGNLKVEEEPPAPTMSLSQNSPNPVLTSTTFSYSVSYSEDVTIRLYDVMGREISMLANGRVDAGTHSVSFNPGAIGSLAPGIYYYRLEAPSGVMTRTIVVE
jgi:WD40 repeat protein